MVRRKRIGGKRMRVIEPPRKERIEIIAKNQAEKECETCPCCGRTIFEDRQCIVWNEKSHDKAHFFWNEVYSTTEYHCLHCGCKYETEPYNIKAYPQEDELLIPGYALSIMFLTFTKISIVFTIIGIAILILTIVLHYFIRNAYKKHGQNNEFKPYHVYKKASK